MQFWTTHPDAKSPLSHWHKIVTTTEFADPNHVKRVFRKVSLLPDNVVVFDVGGLGKGYRLSVRIVYGGHLIYIRRVLTHDEYLRHTREGTL